MSRIVAYARSSVVIAVPSGLGAANRVEGDRGLERPRPARVEGVDRRERVGQEPADHLQTVVGDLDPGGLHAGAELVERHGILLRLASGGGAWITDSPRLRLRLVQRPRDALRLALPLNSLPRP